MNKNKELNKAKFLATKYAGKKINLSGHEYVIYGWHGTYSVDCLTDGVYPHVLTKSWRRSGMRFYTKGCGDITATHVTSRGKYDKLEYSLYVHIKDMEQALMSKLNLTKEQLYE
nr:MAG TPA: hypothetical protein [Crassvirales sp.]